MTYDADGEAVDLLDHLLSKQRRRRSSSQEVLQPLHLVTFLSVQGFKVARIGPNTCGGSL
jgi:hypothetical protein